MEDPFSHLPKEGTMKNPYFPRLFEPLDLGPAIGQLPNRIIMGSMHSGLEGYSAPTLVNKMLRPDLSRMATYFERRAQGGCALMITGGISPNKAGWVSPMSAKLDTSYEMEMHKLVTSAVHSVGIPTYGIGDGVLIDKEESVSARIVMQILHAGRYAAHPFAVSASSTKSPISPYKAKGLSVKDVDKTIQDFVTCSALAQEAHYDGVEIMGSEGYLINQFLVNETNHRNDKYGGADFQNRMRFAVEIVRQTRAVVGPNFIIIFRLSLVDLIEKGSSWEEVKLLAQAIEDAGATILNTGIGWHQARVPTIVTSVPRAGWAWATKKLREENIVSIPLCAANRFNDPHVIETVLEEECTDLVSMARPFLADPDFVEKSRLGQFEDINTCIACNQACLDHIFVGKVASCLVNPAACHETDIIVSPDSVPEEKRLAIGVIGAGPAGLAFATTAATIGHNVTLYDKSDEIGGQFNMAKRIPGKEEFHETIRYFSRQLEHLQKDGKLNLCLNTEVKYSDMEDGNVDKWILAAGVDPRTPSIPGIEHENVLSYIDVLRHKVPVGKKVAVIGAGGIGFDISEYLLHHNEDIGDKTANDMDVDGFLLDWGVDKNVESPGGLLHKKIQRTKDIASTNSPSLPKRELILMQRKKGKLGKGLGKTSGWVHRATLTKSNVVEMLDSVTYDKVDNNGHLHITVGKQERVLEVDNIILCAGQLSKKDIEKEASNEMAKKIFSIGGAYEALELDAKCAIDMATRLALKITDEEVVPGKHKFQSGPDPGETMYKLINKFK